MAEPATKTRVISADCHICEPPHVFDSVPAKFKDRAPKMMRGADGGDGWSFDGGTPKRTFGIEATAGQTSAVKKISGLRFDEILPGNYDGTAHVADMELDGIDVSVVYPSSAIFVYIEPDRELALACMRSYNDWVLDEFQGASPSRIVGLPMLPVDDGPDACLAELERVQAKGAKALFIPGNPARPYNDPYYDPIYARASAAGLPLTFHRTFGGKPLEADWDELVNQKITAAGTVYRFFSGIKAFTYMVFAGVFERHPDLKLVAGEVNFGWLPFWAQTMEQNFDVRSAMDDDTMANTLRPTEYLGRNLFVTVLDDHVGFKMVKDYPYLADCAMYSTDYPHSVCLWPRSSEHIATLTAGLDPVQTEKLLSGNAARVYGV
jgi:predicted TIM-barrel fold metal-dependent hydrolase